jgi:GMP synthase (glutamine-hydrolysing)
MRLHYLQHVPFEGLGSIRPWAESNNSEITKTRFYADDPLPDVDTIDWLVILGGPMNIYAEIQYPWLAREKAFIRQAIEAQKKVVGICLGAQLIADVLGSQVYANAHKEIGWFPIEKSDSCADTFIDSVLPDTLTALHWHGDTFDPPADAIPIARSAACANQGFVWDSHVVALQFHLETTPQGLKALVDNCGSELVDGPYIQNAEALLAEISRFERINDIMHGLLDGLKQC